MSNNKSICKCPADDPCTSTPSPNCLGCHWYDYLTPEDFGSSPETPESPNVKVKCHYCPLAVVMTRADYVAGKTPMCDFCDPIKKARLAEGIANEAAGIHSEYDY
jgi:hypothetical protein